SEHPAREGLGTLSTDGRAMVPGRVASGRQSRSNGRVSLSLTSKRSVRIRPAQVIGGTSASLAGGAEAGRRLSTRSGGRCRLSVGSMSLVRQATRLASKRADRLVFRRFDVRVAIYTRYSSDKQNEASIEDQVRL